jgi:hypothetical protein
MQRHCPAHVCHTSGCSEMALGPGQDFTDLYGEWAEIREVDEAGCLLVCPDGYIAWRAQDVAMNAKDAERRLLHALRGMLGRSHAATVNQPMIAYPQQ